MPLVSKATATTTLKNGKVKLNKGFREVETKTGKKMYFSDVKKTTEKPKKQKVEKAEKAEQVEEVVKVKRVRKSKKTPEPVVQVELDPEELEFD
jgi:hypothetical protein